MKNIKKLLSGIELREKFSLKELTWYKVGGEAELAVFPKDLKEISKIFVLCKKKKIPFCVIGGGANIIVSDDGIEGITIITSKLNKVRLLSGKIIAECGVSLEGIAEYAYEKEISGFEFLYDIPGSVGGSIIMNAGNNYGEINDILFMVRAINSEGKLKQYPAKYSMLGYRTSVFKEKNMFVLNSVFKAFKTKDKSKIRKLMDYIKTERHSKFPLEYPNGGSVFKRPVDDYAGRLIEVSGCGGMKVGGAEVSMKHKGFIVNKKDASASDIKLLIKKVQSTVKEKTGTTLEREQIFLPEDLM